MHSSYSSFPFPQFILNEFYDSLQVIVISLHRIISNTTHRICKVISHILTSPLDWFLLLMFLWSSLLRRVQQLESLTFTNFLEFSVFLSLTNFIIVVLSIAMGQCISPLYSPLFVNNYLSGFLFIPPIVCHSKFSIYSFLVWPCIRVKHPQVLLNNSSRTFSMLFRIPQCSQPFSFSPSSWTLLRQYSFIITSSISVCTFQPKLLSTWGSATWLLLLATTLKIWTSEINEQLVHDRK